MHTDFLLDTFSKNRNNEAIIWKEKSFDYHQTITKKDKKRKSVWYYYLPNLVSTVYTRVLR